MAITMNDSKIDNSKRETLNAKTVGEYSLGFTFDNGNFAGISNEFASVLGTKLGDFGTAIRDQIKKINTDTDATSTFKGANLVPEIGNFLKAVIDVAESFATALEYAERKVTEDVYNAYLSQDQTLKADVSGESDTLEAEKIEA